MRYGKSMSEALAEIREGFSKKQIKMAIGIASDPRYKQGNYSGAFKQIEKIKKGLASHPQVAAVLKRQNEEILEKVKCPDCEGEGCPKCEGNGYMADAVDKEDEPFLKDLIKNLRKGSATHGKQADDLEKAVKEDIELDEGKMSPHEEKISKAFKTKNPVEIKGIDKLIDISNMADVQSMQKQNPKEFKNTVMRLGESIELNEALKPKDKKTVDAFYKGEFMNGFALISDGKKLYSTTQTIAIKDGSKFKIVAKMDGRFTQSVVNYIKKTFPKNVVTEGVELSEKKFDVKTEFKGKITVTPFSKLDDAKRYLEVMRKKGHEGIISQGGRTIKEEVEVDEAVKYQFVAIDRLGKVIGFASDERDAKDMATRGHTMDSPSKGKGVVGRNKAKVVKLKKPMSDKQGDMMINRDFDMKKFGGETTYSVGLKEEDELDENRAARDARRAMSKDKDMQQRPFDKDDKATAIDIQKGKQNIVVQLKKAINLGGSKPLEFDSGPSKKIDPKFARAALDKLNKIKRSDDKLKFQMKLSKSYKDMLQALKEDYEIELDEGKMKAISMKIDSITAKMKKDKQMKSFADKFKKDAMKSMDIKKSLEKILPDYIAGKDIAALVKEETVVESWELDEMKMDDPKLLKIFDKLKKGSTVKIKIDSSISKGKDYREFTVTAKNIVGKGKKFEQEKITLKAKDNPTGVKHFLYNRDGKVTLAIGDMGASIADIKENNMSAYTAAITKGVK